jgi:hypothetical protein
LAFSRYFSEGVFFMANAPWQQRNEFPLNATS